MTAEHTAPPTITLPAHTAARIAALLADLDQLLRSNEQNSDRLDQLGISHAGFEMNNLIDQVSFTAAQLNALIAATDVAADR